MQRVLIEFKVGNYLSFNEIQVLRMGRKNDSGGYTAHKSGFVFGPNSSGKSNLMKAIYDSLSLIRGDYGVVGTKRQHLDKKGLGEDSYSYFEYVVQLSDCDISYGFEMDMQNGDIRSEWLYELGDVERRIFEFLPDSASSVFVDERDRERLYFEKVYVNEDLNISAGRDSMIVAEAGNWFRSMIIKVTGDVNEGIPVAKDFRRMLQEQLALLKTGISEVVFTAFEKQDIPRNLTKGYDFGGNDGIVYIQGSRTKRSWLIFVSHDGGEYYEVRFRHGSSYLARIDEESLGTSRMIRILAMISSQQIDGRCGLVGIDEIECSIHTLAMVQIMKLFITDTLNGSQILVTTHESRLMDLVRPDDADIWFVDYREKGDDRASVLYSLSSFQGSFSNYERMYMDGRFAAVPAIVPLNFGDERCW